ncbi:hypothetical protein SAMN05216262_108120 [Colwellia chukchiensis]|uniref:Acyltransferase n=1 Tax=Colwellia chukchiensis TaxID=641665 RepID=A0A1H7NX90_9GAMM|nr:hypothetical protein SAMN05216262_108120 [Colwellia chukchiensis]
MAKSISLSAYVKRRNGVALGAKGSMSQMFKNSFGAASFQQFWHYWNPIWGFYLARNVMSPLQKIVPAWCAIILTFAVSGALHDLAISIIKWRFSSFFTLWFFCMSLAVLITKKFNIHFHSQPWLVRSAANMTLIMMCLWLATTIERFILNL